MDMDMDIDHPPARSSFFSGCLTSPSWFPANRDPSRFHLLRHEAGPLVRRRSWRNLLQRLLKEGKTVYSSSSSKPISFLYDAVSYSKNFDDGCPHEDAGPRREAAGSWRTTVGQRF